LASRKHPGVTQDAYKRHPGGSRRHPGGPRRIQEARDILEPEYAFSYAPAHKSEVGDHLRVDGSDVTITVYRACAQKITNVRVKIAGNPVPTTEDTPPEAPQQRLVGEQREGEREH